MKNTVRTISILLMYATLFVVIFAFPRNSYAREIPSFNKGTDVNTFVSTQSHILADTKETFSNDAIDDTVLSESVLSSPHDTDYSSFVKGHTKPMPTHSPTPTQPTNNSMPVSPSFAATSTSDTTGGIAFRGEAHNFFVTSRSYWFFIALIGNILWMLLGGYLRLRSGRSPGVVLVYS